MEWELDASLRSINCILCFMAKENNGKPSSFLKQSHRIDSICVGVRRRELEKINYSRWHDGMRKIICGQRAFKAIAV